MGRRSASRRPDRGGARAAAARRRSSPRRPRRGPRAPAAPRSSLEPGRASRSSRRTAPPCARRADRVVRLVLGRRRARPPEQRRVLAEVEGHPLEPGADPDDLARGAVSWSSRPAGSRDAARQHVGLPERDRGATRPGAGRAPRAGPHGGRFRASSAGNARGSACSVGSTSRRKAASEARPQAPEDVRVAPLALGAAGPQLAAHQQLLAFQLDQDRARRRGRSERSHRRS